MVLIYKTNINNIFSFNLIKHLQNQFTVIDLAKVKIWGFLIRHCEAFWGGDKNELFIFYLNDGTSFIVYLCER